MIKTLKKHKYKLLTLMLSIVSIFTLFLGINKTYAYTTDQLTYTISSITDQNNNVVSPITVDNKTGYIYNASNYNQPFSFGINVSNSANVNFAKCYLMFNYYLYDGTNIQNYDNSSASCTIRFFYNNGNSNTYLQLGSLRNNQNMYNAINNNLYTFIGIINIGNALSVTNSRIYLNLSNFNYGFLITNIDVVPFTDIGLQQYYETYYGQIEQNYNDLLSDYNTLQDNYDTLDNNYDTLQNNYDALEDDYSELQENYSNLEDKTSYGIFGYLQDANFQYNIQNKPFVSIDNKTTFELNDLQQLGIISSGGNYQAYYFETNYNPNYYGVIGNFYFGSSLPLTLIDLTFKDMDGALVEILDDEGGTARFNITSSLQTINYNSILEISSSFSNFVDEIHITPNNAELMGSMLTSSNYNVGYLYGTQIGFKNGRDSLQSSIDFLNNQVNELEQEVSHQYDVGYQQGLNVGANQNLETSGMKTLFNSILSYPVNMIRSVFDFEFMGINVTSLIMFIVSIGIVAFVIKKFL